MNDKEYNSIKKQILKAHKEMNTDDFIRFVVAFPQARAIVKEIITFNDLEEIKYKKIMEERISFIEEILDLEDGKEIVIFEDKKLEKHLSNKTPISHYYENFEDGLEFIGLGRDFNKKTLKYNNTHKTFLNFNELKEELIILFNDYKNLYENNSKEKDIKDFVNINISNFFNDLDFYLESYIGLYLNKLIIGELFKDNLVYHNALFDYHNYQKLYNFYDEKTYESIEIKDVSMFDIISEYLTRFVYLLLYKNNENKHDIYYNKEFSKQIISEITYILSEHLGLIDFDLMLNAYIKDHNQGLKKEMLDDFFKTNKDNYQKFLFNIKQKFNLNHTNDNFDFAVGHNGLYDLYRDVNQEQFKEQIMDNFIQIFFFEGLVLINKKQCYKYDFNTLNFVEYKDKEMIEDLFFNNFDMDML